VEKRLELQSVPSVELTCNPSSFAVYCGVRRSVLANFIQHLSASLRRDVASVDSDSDADDDEAGKSGGDAGTVPPVPKVNYHTTVFILAHISVRQPDRSIVHYSIVQWPVSPLHC